MKHLIVILIVFAFISSVNAKTHKPKTDANGTALTRECKPPKRLIEVDALADDAGRPSKVVCR